MPAPDIVIRCLLTAGGKRNCVWVPWKGSRDD